MARVKRAKKVIEFTVNRNKWLRGHHTPNGEHVMWSWLLDSNGNMCCLGFYGVACGLVKKNLLDRAMPMDYDNMRDKKEATYPTWLTIHNEHRGAQSELSFINDDGTISDDVREKALKEEFAKYGVKVKFVGKKRK